ncbi:MAG: hypothetical protein J6Z31_00480 [Fibrobacter sp.]|nr:hypothetical protein [Fibrobacter sp.]
MRFLLLSTLLLTFGLVACKVPGSASDPTLARVENSELKRSEMLAEGPWDSLSLEERTSRVEHWISRESVYERALAEKIDELPEVKRLIEDAKKKIVLGAYFAQVTDTLSVSEAEIAAYYEAHPENFALESNVYNLALVTYMSGNTAWQYYGPATRKKITEAPATNWLVREVESFDSVTVAPFECPVVNLDTLSVGKISPPKTCGKYLKSVIVLAKRDSGSVRPLNEVADLAQVLAANGKRKDFIASFKENIKKRQAIFVYPEEIAK